MNRLFTNATMSFISMYGRNLGKVAFGKSHICGVVIGKSNILHAPAVDITFWCRDRPKTDFTFSAENENGPKMEFHFRPETETKTKTATGTYFWPKTKTKLSSSSNNMRQSNVLLCEL